MKRRQKPIKYKKERVILSDVLPFEIPLTFSNRHMYDFLVSKVIEIKNNSIKWKDSNAVTSEIIKLLFGFNGKIIAGNELIYEKKIELKTIPFNFKISHKENDFRELSIIHPKNQLLLIDFYENNKQLILHYCSISPFSIRKATSIAKFIYYKDSTHKKNISENQRNDAVEMYNKEYESLRTFFVYKKYSNIHKFYESFKYHQCEKKYDKLFKFDISKCFDSIYSHSISWALLNKEIVKDNIKLSDKTFGGKFDNLMQNLNYGETNGIVIGPEFSRIFAELILQRVDKNVEESLRINEHLIHKVDYEAFRYVDDFFIFYNNDATKETILREFRLQLKAYKLYLNDSKSILYNKPIITPITITKQRITELIDESIIYKSSNTYSLKMDIEESIEIYNINKEDPFLTINSNKLIIKLKTIVQEVNIDYKDILNYTLSLIEGKISKIFEQYKKYEINNISEKRMIKAILEILDFVFFLYSVSPRVNTTIKLCKIIQKVTNFLNRSTNSNNDFRHAVLKKIYDNIYFTLQKNKTLENTQVETLYLLTILGQLGKEYWLGEDTLRQYMCIAKVESGKLFFNGSLNYFTITGLLFYMKNKIKYNDLRQFLKDHIHDKFNIIEKKNIGKSAELVFLLFDILTCPYLDNNFKKEILSLHGVIDSSMQELIINSRKSWFTIWTDFDFGLELDAKHSQEVY
jgi:hypothetical protein